MNDDSLEIVVVDVVYDRASVDSDMMWKIFKLMMSCCCDFEKFILN